VKWRKKLRLQGRRRKKKEVGSRGPKLGSRGPTDSKDRSRIDEGVDSKDRLETSIEEKHRSRSRYNV
jgi:hypothetical protein